MIKTAEKAEYFSSPSTDISGSSADERTHLYMLENEGIMFRKAHFVTEKKGEPIEILQLSDMHLNCLDADDCVDMLPCIASTREFRYAFRDGSTVPNTKRSMALSRFFDKTIVTGDTIDYITHGSFELMDKLIWEKYPNTVVTLGGHDITRVMQGKVSDDTTLESRYELLQSRWKHDVWYTSCVLGNKVRAVCLNNGESRYYRHQTEKLRADIADARTNRHIVLVFQHEPICTHNPDETDVTPIRINDGSGTRDFCNNFIGNDRTAPESLELYREITENADVVKGVFCGHWHSDYYTEIVGKTPDGEKVLIPQYVLTGNMYDRGHAMIITVD